VDLILFGTNLVLVLALLPRRLVGQLEDIWKRLSGDRNA
jgi:hypothetical protein